MTSTGTFQGLVDGRKSSKVLKPPGGGSSDIFGSGEETSPRRVKNHNSSQLGSALYGDSGSSTGSTSPETPRANKPGNDSYKRLFGPPDPAPQNTKNHMRSNISLCGDDIDSVNGSISHVNKNDESNGTHINGTTAFNGNAIINDNTAFRRIKRFRGSSCLTRNPVTGDGIEITPIRRTRRCRDRNPVTGITPDQQNNSSSHNGSSSSSINGDSKSTTDSSPSSTKPRTRVPPGGYSSGLW
ncbi:microtubule-associated protein Jupiter isoform X2 [Chelonus insularis]|uniref:microtubule-associated protein Jupiter isoform X2 n=1 Tax=Chelonus insularis TaxID=460826 RepID=UPI00158B01F0|nr:microtubule-associated protein Jupiter isoform X2 [Chelonus insularis]